MSLKCSEVMKAFHELLRGEIRAVRPTVEANDQTAGPFLAAGVTVEKKTSGRNKVRSVSEAY